MTVGQQQVEQLKRVAAGDQSEHNLDQLESPAEVMAYQIALLRRAGADVAAIVDHLEVLLRASEVSRESVHEARRVLAKLKYPPEVTSMMARVARRAKPRPLPWAHAGRRS